MQLMKRFSRVWCRGFHIYLLKIFPAVCRLKLILLRPSCRLRHCRLIHYVIQHATRLHYSCSIRNKTCCMTTFQIIFYLMLFMKPPWYICRMTVRKDQPRNTPISPPSPDVRSQMSYAKNSIWKIKFFELLFGNGENKQEILQNI